MQEAEVFHSRLNRARDKLMLLKELATLKMSKLVDVKDPTETSTEIRTESEKVKENPAVPPRDKIFSPRVRRNLTITPTQKSAILPLRWSSNRSVSGLASPQSIRSTEAQNISQLQAPFSQEDREIHNILHLRQAIVSVIDIDSSTRATLTDRAVQASAGTRVPAPEPTGRDAALADNQESPDLQPSRSHNSRSAPMPVTFRSTPPRPAALLRRLLRYGPTQEVTTNQPQSDAEDSETMATRPIASIVPLVQRTTPNTAELSVPPVLAETPDAGSEADSEQTLYEIMSDEVLRPHLETDV